MTHNGNIWKTIYHGEHTFCKIRLLVWRVVWRARAIALARYHWLRALHSTLHESLWAILDERGMCCALDRERSKATLRDIARMR